MEPSSLFNDRQFIQFARAALILFMVYLGILAVAELKGIRFIGSGVAATNTISVSGEGVTYAQPDVATFSVSVQQTAKDVPTAQSEVNTAANTIDDYIKSAGVDAKDIQTADYSIQPQYEYQNTACPASAGGAPVYCPPGRQVLTGYQVSETISVKVRDTSKAGDILAGVGSKGATNVSGLTFTVDNPAAVQQQARDQAIADAKSKAQQLAKSLGVSLVRIVGFSEGGGANPVPMYAKLSATGAADSAAVPAPQIETGQNKVVSDVTLTYEIE